ncbi:MAG: hypothetical protein IPM06_18770 [Rhizobiales bacterium]|nr:hypothetical protein [Hyphomicrobiales bacterium]
MLNATQRERVEYLMTELKTLAEATDANLAIAFMGMNDDGKSTMAGVVTNMTATTAEAFEKNWVVGYIVKSAIMAIANGVDAKEKTEKIMETFKGLSPEEMVAKLKTLLGEDSPSA